MINALSIPAARTLSGNVYETLLVALLSGELKPGERLRESDLARMLGVSPTPVREALNRMAKDGLIESRPHQGAVVTVFTQADIEDLGFMREVTELAALEHAFASAASVGSGFWDSLAGHVAAAAEAVKNGDRAAYNRHDVALHDWLVDSSGSTRLASSYRTLRNQIQRVRLQTVNYPGRPFQTQTEHEQLLAALRENDLARARNVLRDHIRGTTAAILARTGEADGTSEQARPAQDPSEGMIAPETDTKGNDLGRKRRRKPNSE